MSAHHIIISIAFRNYFQKHKDKPLTNLIFLKDFFEIRDAAIK